jgi:hypothetical protein
MKQSTTRAVLRYFPKAVLPLRGFSWQVDALYGRQLPETYSADLRRSVAEAINEAVRRGSATRPNPLDHVIEELSKKYGIMAAPTGRWVDENKVDIIVPEKGLLALWPPTFYCDNCKTFYYLPKEPIARCVGCGRNQFVQLTFIHVCAGCSRYLPAKPPQKMARYDNRGFYICEKCGRGKICIDVKRRRLSASRWRCSNCGAEEKLMAYCTHGRDGKPQPLQMQLKLTEWDPIKPAIISGVYVRGKRIEKAIADGELTAYVYADRVLRSEELHHLEGIFGVDTENLMLLRDVTAVICAYGYSSGNHAMVRFFEESSGRGMKYKAYASINEGNAIYVKMELSEDLNRPYNERHSKRFVFLHTAEHALTKACHLLAGVQEGAFMGKVFPDSNAIIIYEAAGSEQGGLEYIFKHRLAQLFTEALRLLLTCKYDCGEACPGCIYVRDPLCHPTSGYFVPNDGLDRKLVLEKWMSSR